MELLNVEEITKHLQVVPAYRILVIYQVMIIRKLQMDSLNHVIMVMVKRKHLQHRDLVKQNFYPMIKHVIYNVLQVID